MTLKYDATTKGCELTVDGGTAAAYDENAEGAAPAEGAAAGYDDDAFMQANNMDDELNDNMFDIPAPVIE